MNRCKRVYIYIYKCLQYFKNRADILTQLSGTSAFWASRSPLEDYQKNQQYLPSNVRSLVSVNHVTCVYILSAVPRGKTALDLQRHENPYTAQQQ